MVRATLELANAIITGHFILRSGLHSATYVNKDALYAHPREVHDLCSDMAREWIGHSIGTVVGPEKGGIILAQYAGLHLQNLTGKEVYSVYAERANGSRFELRRNYDSFVKGRQILITEDVMTTGESVKLVINAVRAAGGEVAGVSVIVNRGGITAEMLGVPRLHTMLSLPTEAHHKDTCPLCIAQVPINLEIGAGKDHLLPK
jgi:orotate phosphoribosyltransferase